MTEEIIRFDEMLRAMVPTFLKVVNRRSLIPFYTTDDWLTEGLQKFHLIVESKYQYALTKAI